MSEDLEFTGSLVSELQQNIKEWSIEKIIDRIDVMFHAFHKRFALEDFIFNHVKPTGVMKNSLEQFLKIRRAFRKRLENILLLNIDEPDFRNEIAQLLKAMSSHMIYLTTEFEPDFIKQVSADQMALMSATLKSEIHLLSFI
jgi:hypothetical protein